VLHRGRQLAPREQEPTVAGDHQRLAATAFAVEGDLCADALGVTGAERTGSSRRLERSRPAEVERQVGGEPDLGDVLDEDPVVGEYVADGDEKVELRPEVVDLRDVAGAPLGQLVGSVGPAGIPSSAASSARTASWASPHTPIVPRPWRSSSSTSILTNVIAGSVPQCMIGHSMREPMPITTSAVFHSA
jgi:hypothetical protein